MANITPQSLWCLFVMIKVPSAPLTSALQHKLYPQPRHGRINPVSFFFFFFGFWGRIEAHCTHSCTAEWAVIKSEYNLEPWVNHILRNPLLIADKSPEMWAAILEFLFGALGPKVWQFYLNYRNPRAKCKPWMEQIHIFLKSLK